MSPKVSDTSAIPSGLRYSVPLKITSSIFSPRRLFALCSPSTQRMASARLLFPQPFGPTTALMPGWSVTTVLSKNDLNPNISSFLRRIASSFGRQIMNESEMGWNEPEKKDRPCGGSILNLESVHQDKRRPPTNKNHFFIT